VTGELKVFLCEVLTVFLSTEVGYTSVSEVLKTQFFCFAHYKCFSAANKMLLINLSFKSFLLTKRHAWCNKRKLVINRHISLIKKAMKVESVGRWFF
jgi:hypothetical protein